MTGYGRFRVPHEIDMDTFRRLQLISAFVVVLFSSRFSFFPLLVVSSLCLLISIFFIVSFILIFFSPV